MMAWAPAMTGSLPSLGETLAQWEQAYRQRMTVLESQNAQQQQDLVKWQDWYKWASGEITTAQNDKKSLEAKTAKLEEAIQAAETIAGFSLPTVMMIKVCRSWSDLVRFTTRFFGLCGCPLRLFHPEVL